MVSTLEKPVSKGSLEQENKPTWWFILLTKEKLQFEGDMYKQKIGSKKMKT